MTYGLSDFAREFRGFTRWQRSIGQHAGRAPSVDNTRRNLVLTLVLSHLEDRHDTVEARLSLLADHAHPTTGDLFQQLIVTEVADRFTNGHGVRRILDRLFRREWQGADRLGCRPLSGGMVAASPATSPLRHGTLQPHRQQTIRALPFRRIGGQLASALRTTSCVRHSRVSRTCRRSHSSEGMAGRSYRLFWGPETKCDKRACS